MLDNFIDTLSSIEYRQANKANMVNIDVLPENTTDHRRK